MADGGTSYAVCERRGNAMTLIEAVENVRKAWRECVEIILKELHINRVMERIIKRETDHE